MGEFIGLHLCVCVYAVTHWGGLVCLGFYQNVSCGCRRQKLCGIWLGGMRCGWRYALGGLLPGMGVGRCSPSLWGGASYLDVI